MLYSISLTVFEQNTLTININCFDSYSPSTFKYWPFIEPGEDKSRKVHQMWMKFIRAFFYFLNVLLKYHNKYGFQTIHSFIQGNYYLDNVTIKTI